jgi:DNA-binding transcriptional LysR family regulator
LISQPPLSKQIRQLEDEVGTNLLTRSRRHVNLTEAGKRFLVEAKGIITKSEKALEAARRTGSGERGGLVVGYTAFAAIDVLPKTLVVFRHRWPDVDVRLRRLCCPEQTAGLHGRKIDLGFLCLPVPRGGIELEVILREPFVAVLPSHHSLAPQKMICLSDLAGERFIFDRRDCDMGYRARATALCRKAGFALKGAVEAHEEDSIFPMIASGAGVSLLPASTRKLPLTGIALRELKDCSDQVELAVAWRKGDDSPVVKNLRAAIRERECGSKAGAA